jgi:hypothetical protein
MKNTSPTPIKPWGTIQQESYTGSDTREISTGEGKLTDQGKWGRREEGPMDWSFHADMGQPPDVFDVVRDAAPDPSVCVEGVVAALVECEFETRVLFSRCCRRE